MESSVPVIKKKKQLRRAQERRYGGINQRAFSRIVLTWLLRSVLLLSVFAREKQMLLHISWLGSVLLVILFIIGSMNP